MGGTGAESPQQVPLALRREEPKRWEQGREAQSGSWGKGVCL